MANKIKHNPFDAFEIQTKKVKLESLDGYEAEIKPLSKSQSDAFNKRIIKGYSKDGSPELNMGESWKISLEKVAAVLVDPAITVEQLITFDSGKVDALIKEIGEIIGETDETIDDEGNLEN